MTDSGNLSASELSDVIGGDPHLLRHGGKPANLSCRRGPTGGSQGPVAKVRGRVRFQGSAASPAT